MWEILGFREWKRNQCAKVIKEQQKERESSLKNRTVLEHTYLHKRFLENKWVMFGLLCLALIHDPHSIWFYSPSHFLYTRNRENTDHICLGLKRATKLFWFCVCLCKTLRCWVVLSGFSIDMAHSKSLFLVRFIVLSNEKTKQKTVHCFICSHETLINC